MTLAGPAGPLFAHLYEWRAVSTRVGGISVVIVQRGHLTPARAFLDRSPAGAVTLSIVALNMVGEQVEDSARATLVRVHMPQGPVDEEVELQLGTRPLSLPCVDRGAIVGWTVEPLPSRGREWWPDDGGLPALDLIAESL
jgi:hypothetical protein